MTTKSLAAGHVTEYGRYGPISGRNGAPCRCGMRRMRGAVYTGRVDTTPSTAIHGPIRKRRDGEHEPPALQTEEEIQHQRTRAVGLFFYRLFFAVRANTFKQTKSTDGADGGDGGDAIAEHADAGGRAQGCGPRYSPGPRR